MAIHVKELLDDISHMQYFTVIREIDGCLPFKGSIPFDMKVTENGTAFFYVLAKDMEDASVKVNDWLNSLYT